MSTTLKLSVAEDDQIVLRGAFAGLQKKIELFRGVSRNESSRTDS